VTDTPSAPQGGRRRCGRISQATPGPRKNGTYETKETDGTPAAHSPYDLFRPLIETRPPEVAANIIICLIHQTNYLLDQQIRQLEKAFLKQGGLREAMTRARLAQRDKQRRRTP